VAQPADGCFLGELRAFGERRLDEPDRVKEHLVGAVDVRAGGGARRGAIGREVVGDAVVAQAELLRRRIGDRVLRLPRVFLPPALPGEVDREPVARHLEGVGGDAGRGILADVELLPRPFENDATDPHQALLAAHRLGDLLHERLA
jgi:hypothetical protein